MYNVGDKVRIKENANEIHAKGVAWVSSMNKYLGREFTIRSLAGNRFYLLDGCHICDGTSDSDYYWFGSEWLELVEDCFINEIETNDLLSLFQ